MNQIGGKIYEERKFECLSINGIKYTYIKELVVI
jgi:hypothetical protein